MVLFFCDPGMPSHLPAAAYPSDMCAPMPPPWMTSCLEGIGLMGDAQLLSSFERGLREELLELLTEGAGGYAPGDGARQSLHLLRALRASAAAGASSFRCQRAELGLLILWRMKASGHTWDAATMPAPSIAQRHLDELLAARQTSAVVRNVAEDLSAEAVGEMPKKALAGFWALPHDEAGEDAPRP